jgi:hypothetical protein
MVLAAMLTIVLVAIVLALVQDGEFDVIPAEEPVYTCAWGPAAAATPNNPCVPDALNTSDHVPGGCMVSYEAVEAMWAAPQENVKDTFEHRGVLRGHGPRLLPLPLRDAGALLQHLQ